MEKLLNLLNEYEEKRIEKINSEWKLMVKLSFRPYTEESLTNQAYRSCWLEICSKYYWFIWWLVEQDKINKFEIDTRMIKSNRLYHWKDMTTVYRVDENLEKVLLMLLAISDTPIEDLISYLR